MSEIDEKLFKEFSALEGKRYSATDRQSPVEELFGEDPTVPRASNEEMLMSFEGRSPDGGYHPVEGLKVFAKGLTKLPGQMIGKSAAAVQGWRGASVVDPDWWDKQYEKAHKESRAFSMKYGERRIFPGISERDVAELPENLAFSGLAAMAGLGVGLPSSAIGGPTAGYTGGMLAAGKAAYNMASYDFMRRYLETRNEDHIKKTGRALTREQEAQIRDEFGNLAQKYGLWEAIPEAMGQATGFKILATPLKKIGEKIGGGFIRSLMGKLGGLYGSELVTETVTQMGQTNIEAAIGEGEARSFTDPSAWWESLKEVAPAVFLLTSVMGGATSLGMRAAGLNTKESDDAATMANQAVLEVGEQAINEVAKGLANGSMAMEAAQTIRDDLATIENMDPAFITELDRIINNHEGTVQHQDISETIDEETEELLRDAESGVDPISVLEGGPREAPESTVPRGVGAEQMLPTDEEMAQVFEAAEKGWTPEGIPTATTPRGIGAEGMIATDEEMATSFEQAEIEEPAAGAPEGEDITGLTTPMEEPTAEEPEITEIEEPEAAEPEAELEGPTKRGNIWYDTITAEQWNDPVKLQEYLDDLQTEVEEDDAAGVAAVWIDERISELMPTEEKPKAVEDEIAEMSMDDIDAILDEEEKALEPPPTAEGLSDIEWAERKYEAMGDTFATAEEMERYRTDPEHLKANRAEMEKPAEGQASMFPELAPPEPKAPEVVEGAKYDQHTEEASYEHKVHDQMNDFVLDHMDWSKAPEGEDDVNIHIDGVGTHEGMMVYPLDDGKYYTIENNFDDPDKGYTDNKQWLKPLPESEYQNIEFYKEYESLAAPIAKEAAERSAKEIIKSAAKHGVKGVDEALKGLHELFGGKALKSFPGGLDEDTYANAKPHFEATLKEFQAAGKDVRAFVRWALQEFGKVIKPYIRHFIQEKKTAAPEPTEIEEPTAGEPEIEEIEEPEGAGEPEGEGITIETPEEPGEKKKKKKRKKKLKDAGEKMEGKRSSKDHRERTDAIEIELGEVDTDADAEQLLRGLKKITQKGSIFKVDHGVEGATPGRKRFLTKFRNELWSWLQYTGRMYGGSTGRWRMSFDKAIIRELEIYGDDAQEKVKKVAAEYISILEQLNEAVKGTITVRQARDAMLKVLYTEEANELWADDESVFKDQVSSWYLFDGDLVSETGEALAKYVRKNRQMYVLLSDTWSKIAETEEEADKDQPIVRIRRRIQEIETPDEYRNGKDKKGEDLISEFGLRGVEYGEWAEADHRQTSVNLAYDSFMMLAEAIGAPNKGISVMEMKRLGIAFGSRGRGGRAAAHFEPSNNVINLTKTNGDGSLAHEWAHALDYMTLSENMGVEFDGQYYNVIDDLKHALRYRYEIEKLDEIVEQILRGLRLNSGMRSKRLEDAKKFLKSEWEREIVKRTQFFQGSIGLDGGIQGKYYSKQEEMFARAFEAWLADKLQGDNYYLVDADFVAPGNIETTFNRQHGAYPTEAERERFNLIMDHFFEGMEWSKDGIPSIKEDYQPATLYEKDLAQKAIDDLLEKVEELYEEIYKGEPSEDGFYWYGYEQTSRGPQMQPHGFIGYDDKYAIEPDAGDNINGTGAIAYEESLTADDVLKYGLRPVRHDDNTNKIYVEADDAIEIDSEEALEEMEAEDDETPGEEGPSGPRPQPGEREGDRGDDGFGDTEGGAPRPGVGDGDTEIDLPTGREDDADTAGGPDAVQPEPIDYVITTTDELTTTGLAERFSNNIAAIRTLKQIEGEGRMATAEEQAILVKYNGWGELSGALEDLSWVGDTWRGRAEMLAEVLTDEERQSLKASSLNAYYTPPGIINQMYQTLMRFGFRGGRILEPAVGVGHFFGMMPEEMRRNSALTGIDRDGFSTRIASQLYQSTTILNNRLEDTTLPDNFYDLTVSNVPFGTSQVHDPKHNPLNYQIHDYFINKMINVTKPGGLIAVITSTGTMDKKVNSARSVWSQEVDFVGAVRLPNGIYPGAQAASDVLFLRKKVDGAPHIEEKAWTKTKAMTMPEVHSDGTAYGYDASPDVNEYFVDNEHMALGTFGYNSGYRGGVQVHGDPGTVAEDMETALKELPGNVYTAETTPDVYDIADKIPTSDVIKEGAFYVGDDGEIYVNDAGTPIKQEYKYDSHKDRVKKMIGVRNVARDLLAFQARKRSEERIKQLRRTLNRRYKAFVKKHGAINLPSNYRLITEDPDAGLLSALENWDASNQKVLNLEAIFYRNTIRDITPPDSADTAQDALVYSQAWRGRVDFAYMAGLTGKTKETLMSELEGQVYDDPEKGWVTADEYLSGNVRSKLKTAEGAALVDKKYEVNVEMLKASIPKDLEAHEVRAKMGAAWVPKSYMQDFVHDLFNGYLPGIKIDYTPAIGRWNITWKGRTTAQANRNKNSAIGTVQATSEYGTNRVNFFKTGPQRGWKGTTRGVLDHALNGGFPTIMENVGSTDDPVWIKREQETDAVANKISMVQQRFSDWAWEDDTRAKELLKVYNETFNSYVDREYDGSHLTFPGKVPDEIIKLRDHQVNAVWRYLQSGTTYLAHEVGTGKTFTMIASIMEAKRLGLATKPIMSLIKTNIDQIRADFLKLYPGANILVLQVPENKQKRKKVLNRIATGEWDAVLVNHDSFKKIPLSKATQAEFIADEVRDLQAALVRANQEGAARHTVRDIESRLENLEQKLRKALDQPRDDVPTMEEMGVDMVVVDEAHTHKNVPFASSFGNIKGVQTQGSNIAQDMYFKTKYLHKRFGRGILFASGTPLTNSVGELFNIKRYLLPKEVTRLGLQTFDAWSRTFGVIRNEAEYAPEGGGFKMTQRFAEFVNIPELMALTRQAMDIRRAKDIGINRPDVVGGKPQTVKVDQNDYVQRFQAILAERVRHYRRHGRNAEYRGVPDNMLRIVNDGRLVAMDARLYDRNEEDYEQTKTNIAVDKVYEIYNTPQAATTIPKPTEKEGKPYMEKKHTQLVFLDRGVPGREMFNLYQDIKDKLVALGIPEKEITFVHNAKTDAQKISLFRKMNDGKIRVLIGSTKKLGTGVNVQKRVSAMHHLDVDWTYANYEQRNGRGWRYGNQIDAVQIFNYGTTKTVDAFMWSTVAYKEKILGQVMSNDPKVRHIEDISKTSMEASEMEALLSDDPLHKEKIELEVAIRSLQNIRSGHEFAKRRAMQRTQQIPHEVTGYKLNIKNNTRHLTMAEKISAVEIGDEFFDIKKEGGKLNKAVAKVAKVKQTKVGTHTFRLGHIIKEKVPTLEVQKSPKTGKEWEVHGEKEVKKFVPQTGDTLTALSKDKMRYRIGPELKYEYDIKKGVSRGLTNIINGLKANITEAETRITTLEAELPKLKEVAESVFDRADELKEKEIRLGVVTQTLLQQQQEEDDAARREGPPEPEGGIDIEDEPQYQIGKAQVVGDATLIEVLRKAPPFKNLTMGISRDGSVWVRFKSGKGFTVKSVDHIAEDKVALKVGHGRMLEDGEFIKGKYQDGTIELQRDLADEWTVTHESIHMAEALGFLRAQDISILRSHIRELEKAGMWDSEGREVGGSEDRAIFATQKIKDRSMKGPVARVLQKIADFIDAMVNIFTATARGVVRDIESGQVFERAPEAPEPLQVPSFSLGKMRDSIRKFGRRKQPRRSDVLVDVVPEGVLPRVVGGRGLSRGPIWDRAKEKMRTAALTMAPGRQFTGMSSKYFGKAIETLRHALAVPAWSKWRAAVEIREILAPEKMAPDNYDLFSMKLILEDMIKDMDAEDGPLSKWQELVEKHGELAFGFQSRAEVAESLDKLNAKIEGNDIVNKALERREKFMSKLRKDLVDAKLLKPEVLEDDRYFHHQVLEFANAKHAVGVGVKDMRVKKHGYQIHRIGSIKDFNTEYIESEFEVVAQGLAQLEMKKTVEEIKRHYDVMNQLRYQAKHDNYVKVVGGEANYQRLIKLRGQKAELEGQRPMDSGTKQALAAINEEIWELDPTMPMRVKIARGLKALDMQIEGDVLELEDEDFDFQLLKRLADDGNTAALMVFKGIVDRRALIKKTLGRNYTTWQDMMRARPPIEGSRGWAVWRPQPGTAWYMTSSINDRILEEVLMGARELEPENVRKVLARGVDVRWVLPAEVVEALDGQDFRTIAKDNVISGMAESTLNWWKRWILINPMRIFKYNLNNLSGDFDIAFAYDPKIMKYAGQAIKDMWAFHYNKEMSPTLKAELDEAVRSEVIGSGMTVHDIPDIGRTPQIRQMVEAMGADKTGALRYIGKAWEGSKNFTTWRENVLRLAAFRYFKDRIAAGDNVYGASEQGKVDATTDPGRKAALLARELIGDYGGLSKGGQWLRKKAIPFYSWMEINAPRYVRMYQNLAVEGEPRGRRTRAGAVLAKKAALLTAKATMLYAMVNVFNHLFWADEEEELGDLQRRQLHLILGRRSDGSIRTLRFQGALSDALGWFNLHDFPSDVEDLATGKTTVYKWLAEGGLEPANKLIQGVRPDVKVPVEMMTKRQLYPEFWRPRLVRDRWEHAARVFSAEKLYRHAAGKPIRGDSVAARVMNDLASVFTYTADPGEMAYHDTRALVSEFLKDKGIERPMVDPTSRSNALYYYKQAIKFGHVEAAERYLEKYKAMGGKMKYLKVSIKRAHPLANLPRKKRTQFFNRITARDKDVIKRATKWYKQTYKRKAA